jgi:hypothetical protein
MQTKIWKTLVLGTILIIASHESFGQIGQIRSDIIKEEGFNYESGTADDGTKYIAYEKEFTTEQSGTYTQYKVIYFMTLDDGTEFCHYWKILEPSSETNPNVAYFKKNLVEVDYMKWKDYESGVIYTIDVEDGLCIITAWYDIEKQ